jgi:hypothetical protein
LDGGNPVESVEEFAKTSQKGDFYPAGWFAGCIFLSPKEQKLGAGVS